MAKYTIQYSQLIEVDLKDEAFTEEFMEEYRQSFYPYSESSEHAEHIAQLVARELVADGTFKPDEFVEGYGPIGEFVNGINRHYAETERIE